MTSPGWLTTQYTYDVAGRRVSTMVDSGGLNLVESYTYDRNGNVVARTDARGNVTRFAYDTSSGWCSPVDDEGGVRKSTYDAEGRVISTTAYGTIDRAGLAAHSAAIRRPDCTAAPAGLGDPARRGGAAGL
ncbi:MAG: RHS repeat protein [Anaeromyxobacter sp.]